MDKVYLSRRNLLVLLSKLDRKAAGEVTQCTLIKQDNRHPKYPQTMEQISVVAVEDDEYYSDRMAGQVHPIDEARIKQCSDCAGTGLVESWDSTPGVIQFETCHCQYKDPL